MVTKKLIFLGCCPKIQRSPPQKMISWRNTYHYGVINVLVIVKVLNSLMSESVAHRGATHCLPIMRELLW